MVPLIPKRRGIAYFIAAALGCASFGASAQQTADILWRNTATGVNVVWLGGNYLQTKQVAPANRNWHVVGTSVSSFDGMTSVIWRNRVDGRNVGWPSAEAYAVFNLPTVPKQSWTLAGMGYFDTNTHLFDLLWRDSATGSNVLWRIGVGNYGDTITTVDPDWKIVGVGDFDGDMYSDVLWRNQVTGANTIWLRADSHTLRATTAVANLAWQVVGVGDFDRDGFADILWRNADTGRDVIWHQGLSTYAVALATVSRLSWHVVGVGDFDGNGTADVLWRDAEGGRNVIWPSANAASQIPLATVPNPAWIVAAVGNFDYDPWGY